MLKNFLSLILKSIRYRPIRSWLTIVGVVIGIMLVVVILSLGSGIKSVVSRTLQMFGSDIIIIFPGKETNPLVGVLGQQKFRESDLMELEKIEGIKFVVPRETAILNGEYKGEKKSIMVYAAPWKGLREIIEESQGIKLEKGRWPTDDQAKEVVLGYKIFNNLFKERIKLGDEITIKSKRMKVVGVISEIGEQMADNLVYVSMDIFRQITGFKAGARSALVKVLPEANINLVAKQIELQLSKQEVVSDFSVLTPDKVNRLIGNVLAIIELSLIMIAFISLIVGAVGITNTMYTSVIERTKQIGIMKAIGASKESILLLFLIESGMIGLIGGILGVIFGLILAFLFGLVASSFGLRGLFSFASLDFLGFFVVLIITFIVGVISGVMPARQAANLEPAEALRYE